MPCRIIPARAGFTRSCRTVRRRRRRDHPRSRGVYARILDYGEAGCGSSPLARGLLEVHTIFGEFERIIPARAGFTRGRST